MKRSAKAYTVRLTLIELLEVYNALDYEARRLRPGNTITRKWIKRVRKIQTKFGAVQVEL